jgi:hypothetical protein
MKKIKLKGHQVKFIINMIGLAVFAISYLYIYTYFEDKADKTYEEVKVNQAMIEAIKKNISEEDTVRQKTDELNTNIQAIIDSYPVDVKKVDNHMFVEQIEKNGDFKISFSSVEPTDSTPFFDTVVPIRNSGDAASVCV